MKKLIVLLLVLVGCGEKGKLDFVEMEREDFNPIINSTRTPAKPDLASVKTIINRDYPIEIALFEDGRWYYDLPNLDDGFGTWKFESGKLILEAERDLFNMEIDVLSLNNDASKLGLHFQDRFGFRTIEVEQISPTK
tara:strand:- start:197 stop:607 length:411 start_codon:yes stop_codon:yes gene_type:complete